MFYFFSNLIQNLKKHDFPSSKPCSSNVNLSDISNQHVSEIDNHIADEYETSGERSETNSPIFDSLYNEGGNGAMKSMINFAPVEFTKTWTAVSAFVSPNSNTKHGRKISFIGENELFMVLTVLKHVQQWDFTARMSGIKNSKLERVVTNFMKFIYDHLYAKFVQRLEG